MMRATVSTLWVVPALLLGLATVPAAAQQPVGDGDRTGAEKPWEVGVSPENRQAAKDLTREGNQLVKEYQWASAAEKYRSALKLWDHPAIHYNLAMALLNLDQPLELYKTLTSAVKYGADGMGAGGQAKFDKAQREKDKAEKLLARVKISCPQPGVVVSLDGNQIFEGPGNYEDWVMSGSHTVKATKPGFLAVTENRKLTPGEVLELPIELMTAAQLTRYKRRWPAWQPWLVFGGGVVITGTAGFLHSRASANFKDFDQGVADCGGCVPDDALASKKSNAETQQLLAFIGYGVGGAALVAGSVLLYINRAKSYRLDEGESAPPPAAAAIAPWFGPDGAGVSASYRF